ncbi:MAG: hypothetical protein M3R40_06425, partial [Pseudomonadota bacterium]|nr:hypothetical protein [Pseudomonadota bacterium]
LKPELELTMQYDYLQYDYRLRDHECRQGLAPQSGVADRIRAEIRMAIAVAWSGFSIRTRRIGPA